MKKTQKGAFITFEGADGAGKTTQISRLLDYFKKRNRPALATREPGGTPAGERIRALLLDPAAILSARTEALLYLAARAEHVAQVIKPALCGGTAVLCDRFNDSTYVYQCLARGLLAEELMPMVLWASGGLAPDLTFLLDAEPACLSGRQRKRGQPDRLEREGLEFQRKVRAGFLALARESPERIVCIDALLDVDEIQAIVQNTVEKKFFAD